MPVIVWVAPAGGFAASAGTFITLAGNVALMAPGTNIGAASPISGDGKDIPGTLGDKVINDTIAKITLDRDERGAATSTGRSRPCATPGRRPATEAVELGAVDGIAATIEEVIAFANGRTVEVGGQRGRRSTSTGATITEQTMNPFLALIRLLSDPNIALLLFSTGSIGLLAELYSPNFVTGILGALMILLGADRAGHAAAQRRRPAADRLRAWCCSASS